MSKILIAEDDMTIAEIEKDYLEVNGFEVDVVHEGTAALEAIKAGGYDLLLLDVMMPGCNGFDICKQVRGIIDIPILMVTAKMESFDKVRGLGFGADDYITKPFSLSIFRARVEAVFRRLDAKDNKVIKSGKYRLDTDLCKLFCGSEEIPISATEFRLLKYFMSNAGQILSKEQILAALWDNQGNFVDENTLPVNISRLRTKIEHDPKNPKIIKTIHGMGYVWVKE